MRGMTIMTGISGRAQTGSPASRGESSRYGPVSLRPLVEPLTTTEMRVLQYLPTHLSQAQIASELYVSLNTIRTHMRHVYAKLGTHRRAETVERARALGLLALTSAAGW